MSLLIRYDQSGHFYEQQGKMLYKYFKQGNKCALIIFMLNLKSKEWKTQLHHTGLVLFAVDCRKIAHCCLCFYREFSQIISEVYHIKPLAWFKASAVGSSWNLFRNREGVLIALSSIDVRNWLDCLWEVFKSFWNTLLIPPLGLPIIPSLKVQDMCYAFNFIALNLIPPIQTQASMFSLISLIEGDVH